MKWSEFISWTCFCFLFASASFAQQSVEKVCIAGVANSSGAPVLVDRVKDELIAQLKKANVNAISAPTVTMLAEQLDLSFSNRGAFRALKCDYMMLTEIARAGNNRVAEFALFQKDRNSAVLSESLPASSEKEPTDSIMAVLPAISVRVRNRVSREKR